MKKIFSLLIILVLQMNQARAQAPEGFGELAEKLTPAVVNIYTSQVIKEKSIDIPGVAPFDSLPPGHPLEEFNELFNELYKRRGGENGYMERDVVSLGSGFVISEDGTIVTNYHVVADASEINVAFPDDTKFKAEVIGKDQKTDLAVLKIKTDKKLNYVTFGDSDNAKVGDWVIAVGNPFGLGGTVTAGIISARARDINAGPFDDFIQTDAAINRGNSGGPMFNMKGEVIGINTAIFSPSGGSVGIGFAVPSNLAEPIINQLIKDGKIERGWLGVKIQTVSDEIAESLGLDKAKGALVVEVTKDSPADEAGILPGDIIIEYDGKEVNTMKKLPRFVAETKIGNKVKVVVWRDGKRVEVISKIEELKEEKVKKTERKPLEEKEEAPDSEDILGLKVTALTSSLRDRYKVPSDIDGLLVVEVSKSSGKVARVIRAGDIILQANQKKVTTPRELEMSVKEIKAQNRKALLLQLYRNGDSIFFAIPVED